MLLRGIRVVEIGQNLSAPYAGRILADLGADVVKVEKPDGGDDGRRMGPPFHDGDAVMFHVANVNKRSVSVDLKDRLSLEQLLRLVAESDVVLHNLRPGVAESLGVDAGTLRAKFPRLVHATISAFGRTGPLAMRPGYDLLLQAYGGLMSVTGDPDGPPTRAGPSIVDMGSGMWTALGILAALLHRERTGAGCTIEGSLYETALAYASVHISNHLSSGEMPERSADGHPKLAPYQSFATRDGRLILAIGNDRLFSQLADLLGRNEWKRDPRYLTNASRVAHRCELADEVQRIIVGASTADWSERFDRAGIPYAPVATIPDVVRSEQTAALGMIVAGGSDTAPRIVPLPLWFDGARPPIERASPKPGQHTNECLRRAPRPPASA